MKEKKTIVDILDAIKSHLGEKDWERRKEKQGLVVTAFKYATRNVSK